MVVIFLSATISAPRVLMEVEGGDEFVNLLRAPGFELDWRMGWRAVLPGGIM